MVKKEIIDQLLDDSIWESQNNRESILSSLDCTEIPELQQEFRKIANTDLRELDIKFGSDSQLKRNRSHTLFSELDNIRFSENCIKKVPPIDVTLDPYAQTYLIRTDFPEDPIRYEAIERLMQKHPKNKQVQKLGKTAIKNIKQNNDKEFKSKMSIREAHKIAKKVYEKYPKTEDINQKVEMVKELLPIKDNFFFFRFPKEAEKRIIAQSQSMYELNDNEDYNPKNDNWEMLLVSRHWGQFHVRRDDRNLDKNDGRIHGHLYDDESVNWKDKDITPEFIIKNEEEVNHFVDVMRIQTETFYDYITKQEHTDIEPN